MKKLITLMMSCVLISSFVYADQQTCRVYGSTNNNVATVVNPILTSTNLHGQSIFDKPTVYVEIELTQKAEENTEIAINIYDGGSVVASGFCNIRSGSKKGIVSIEVPEQSHQYTAKIANASCE